MSEFVKFDPNYCSSNFVLESDNTRALFVCQNLDRSSILGTKAKSFKVKLISGSDVMIGFAPKCIDVNNQDNYKKCGYYLQCYDGTLYSQKGDEKKSYINSSTIHCGSIVECLLNKKKGTISYRVDGKSYGVAFSKIGTSSSGNYELFPAFIACLEGVSFELVNE